MSEIEPQPNESDVPLSDDSLEAISGGVLMYEGSYDGYTKPKTTTTTTTGGTYDSKTGDKTGTTSTTVSTEPSQLIKPPSTTATTTTKP